MPASGHRSAATLGRLAFRLTIVLILSTLWSGDSAAQAPSVLCLLFAAAVLWTAYARGERPTGPSLNRWHEGAFLAMLGLILFFWFWPRFGERSTLERGVFWGAQSDGSYATIEPPVAASWTGSEWSTVIEGHEFSPPNI